MAQDDGTQAGDGAPVGVRKSKRLDWRMDRSHSDWTIVLIVGGKIHSTYYVHKVVLSFGDKSSEYFSRLFQNEGRKEHETKTSRIELDEVAADAFPVTLDFLYSLWDEGEEKPMKPDNVAALYHLGSYFEIAQLRIKAREFWKANMTLQHCASYYEQAKLFQNEELIQEVVQKCCEQIDDDEIENPELFAGLVSVSDEQLLLKALKENNGKPNRSLSCFVSLFVVERADHIDEGLFSKLTNEEVLPEIHWQAALRLLQHEQTMVSSANGAAKSLSSLQDRCVKGLATDWKHLDSDAVTESLVDCPRVLKEVLSQSVKRVKRSPPDIKCDWLSSVVLSGAAVEACNGTYTRTGDFENGAPVFSMDGVWDNKPATFEISLTLGHDATVADDGRPCWFCTATTKSEANNEELYFYGCMQSEKAVLLPPKHRWGLGRNSKGKSKGVLPGPTLEYRFEQNG